TLMRKMVVSSRSIGLGLRFCGHLFPLHGPWGDSRVCGRRFARDGNALCATPQPFECVMFPDILPENMGNDIAKVHQNPLRSSSPFDAQRFGAGTREDAADMVCDGTRLAIRIRRTYNQVVGNSGQWGYLEDESIGGLLIAHG